MHGQWCESILTIYTLYHQDQHSRTLLIFIIRSYRLLLSPSLLLNHQDNQLDCFILQQPFLPLDQLIHAVVLHPHPWITNVRSLGITLQTSLHQYPCDITPGDHESKNVQSSLLPNYDARNDSQDRKWMVNPISNRHHTSQIVAKY